MSKGIPYFIDRFSYSVFTLDIERGSKKQKMKQAIEKLHDIYPGEVKENRVYIAQRFKNCKTYLVIIAKDDIPLQGICTTILLCSLLPTHTGKVLFATEKFYEYVNFEKGMLVKSTVQKRLSGNALELDTISLCIGLLKDLPTGCKKIMRLAAPSSLAKKYSECVLGLTQKKVFAKVLINVIIICSIMFIGTNFVHQMYAKNRIEMEQKNTIQLQKDEQNAKKQKNIEFLAHLKEKYINLQTMSKISIYKILSSIYTLLEESARIRTITITGNMFQLDAHTSDAVDTFKIFENEKYMTKVEMRRIAIENKKEYFSLSANMVNRINLPLDNGDVTWQIAEYEKLIYEAEQKEVKGYVELSDAAFAVRELLHKNDCNEDVLQYITTNDEVEIECSLQSSAHNFLAFLSDADTAEVPIDFSTVRIRAVENSNDVTVTFRMKTGVRTPNSDMDFLVVENSVVDEEIAVSPEDISIVFNTKKRIVPTIISPPLEPDPVKIEVQPKTQPSNHLEYIGSVKTGGIAYVLIKNTRINEIYKLPFESSNGNTYKVISDSLLTVQIDGIQYEVKK